MKQTFQIILLFILIALNVAIVYAWRRGLRNMNKKKSPFPDSTGTSLTGGSSKKNKTSDLIHLLWPFIAVLLIMTLIVLPFL